MLLFFQKKKQLVMHQDSPRIQASTSCSGRRRFLRLLFSKRSGWSLWQEFPCRTALGSSRCFCCWYVNISKTPWKISDFVTRDDEKYSLSIRNVILQKRFQKPPSSSLPIPGAFNSFSSLGIHRVSVRSRDFLLQNVWLPEGKSQVVTWCLIPSPYY